MIMMMVVMMMMIMGAIYNAAIGMYIQIDENANS